MLYKNLRNKSGFTLVELIAVIVIIGILAAAATVTLTTVLKNNRIKAEKAEIETAFNTCQTFMTEVNGNFSTTTPTLANFAARINLSKPVIEVGAVSSVPTYESAEGVYIKCVYDSGTGRYSVPEIWYVINGRAWSVNSTRTQYTDSTGTKTM